MKMIIGLGNPGKQYVSTRHNVGFQAIDLLAEQLNAPAMQTKFNGMITTVHVGTEKVMLVKPLTYMNLSGECVRPLMDYYEVNDDEIVVIYDDLDLIPGKLRLREKGGAGGHNGMKSLIAHLGTNEFNRIRIGVGRPDGPMNVADYVLGAFSKEEQPMIQEAVERSASACRAWTGTDRPFLEIMNEYNGAKA
ncbi:aminoacyl-tRNA hydrolase [Sporosarcina gallistercoris]|uniref:Peptidyl-tRNA hydrolase n=1 Tax=Sporosarcina gallistercoris TaxID=2762245 RepID=A0ABR8PMY4_9BACL|nr:aminoacyl-tRNA hydrolase [Sporosarcina gallistercoris]MBD7909518.1 aminoacyl-tRNA hydrolase [Sporosarcina gallistercoris]